jgi:hypothetical protein
MQAHCLGWAPCYTPICGWCRPISRVLPNLFIGRPWHPGTCQRSGRALKHICNRTASQAQPTKHICHPLTLQFILEVPDPPVCHRLVSRSTEPRANGVDDSIVDEFNMAGNLSGSPSVAALLAVLLIRGEHPQKGVAKATSWTHVARPRGSVDMTDICLIRRSSAR